MILEASGKVLGGSGRLQEGFLGGASPPDPPTWWYVHLPRHFGILGSIFSSFLGRFFVIFVIFVANKLKLFNLKLSANRLLDANMLNTKIVNIFFTFLA